MMRQVAIVTGGSSGIGQSTALELARRGVGVILTYRGNPDGGLETAERIEQDGGTAVALPLDVGNSETFAEFAAEVTRILADRWDRTTFDFLVNNTGVGQHPVPFEEPPRNCATRCCGFTSRVRTSSPRRSCRCSRTAGRS
nr:SDR family NAD(P)-dependent oxidoreductase [Kribbella turkmenica]